MDVVTRTQFPRSRLSLDEKLGPPRNYQYPFVSCLVVPLSIRGRLAAGNDPFDPYTVPLHEGLEDLAAPCVRQSGQDISASRRHDQPKE
jgi:hypothetical protein